MTQRDAKRDVIILGSGLGGLVAGTFLLRRGHAVSLLREKGYQPFFATQGYRFTPFSSISEKLIEGRILQELSREASLSLTVRRAEGGLQVFLPGARIDISSNRQMLQREWKREFPGELDQIAGFYDEISSLKPEAPSIWKGPFLERIFGQRIDQRLSQFSELFREFVRIQLQSWGNFHVERIPFSLGASLLSRYMSKDLAPGVDSEGLQTSLLKKFSQSGGRIEEIEGVEKADRKGEEFTVSVDDGSLLRCECLILNMPLHRLGNVLGKKGKSLLKWGKRIRPRCLLFPFFLGIRDKVVPVGMKDLSVSVLDFEKPYEGGNFLYLSLSPKGNETKAPEGKRALTAGSFMPFGELDEAVVTEHQKGVMRHLTRLIPFLEDHTEFVDSSWGMDQISRWSYPHVTREVVCEFNWRKGCVPTRISRDLYFVGRENAPYLGLEGEILNGLEIGRLVAGEKS